MLGTDRSLQGPPGRVVQNSSICGTTAVPFLGAYSTSKQAMEGLSQAWRRELLPFGIDVVIVGAPTPLVTMPPALFLTSSLTSSLQTWALEVGSLTKNPATSQLQSRPNSNRNLVSCGVATEVICHAGLYLNCGVMRDCIGIVVSREIVTELWCLRDCNGNVVSR